MTGYVADLSWKSGARAIEKLDRLRSTMAVNVLTRTVRKTNLGTNDNPSENAECEEKLHTLYLSLIYTYKEHYTYTKFQSNYRQQFFLSKTVETQ